MKYHTIIITRIDIPVKSKISYKYTIYRNIYKKIANICYKLSNKGYIVVTKLPLFTIEQTVETYRYLFEPNPTFGMDLDAEDFEAHEIVLLDDTKAGSQGIPIHFGYYALFLRIHGETKRTINQFSYHIKPHSLQLVNPGTIYSFKDIY